MALLDGLKAPPQGVTSSDQQLPQFCPISEPAYTPSAHTGRTAWARRGSRKSPSTHLALRADRRRRRSSSPSAPPRSEPLAARAEPLAEMAAPERPPVEEDLRYAAPQPRRAASLTNTAPGPVWTARELLRKVCLSQP
jgi:hypothetical protein